MGIALEKLNLIERYRSLLLLHAARHPHYFCNLLQAKGFSGMGLLVTMQRSFGSVTDCDTAVTPALFDLRSGPSILDSDY